MAETYDVLADVKSALGITGKFQDNTLKIYLDDVKNFMRDAGVPEAVVDSKGSAGVISRGVSDLWNYGSGGTDLSPYFMKRVIQLCFVDSSIKPEYPYTNIKPITDAEIDDIFRRDDDGFKSTNTGGA